MINVLWIFFKYWIRTCGWSPPSVEDLENYIKRSSKSEKQHVMKWIQKKHSFQDHKETSSRTRKWPKFVEGLLKPVSFNVSGSTWKYFENPLLRKLHVLFYVVHFHMFVCRQCSYLYTPKPAIVILYCIYMGLFTRNTLILGLILSSLEPFIGYQKAMSLLLPSKILISIFSLLSLDCLPQIDSLKLSFIYGYPNQKWVSRSTILPNRTLSPFFSSHLSQKFSFGK